MADVNRPDPEQRLAKFQKALGDKDPYVLYAPCIWSYFYYFYANVIICFFLNIILGNLTTPSRAHYLHRMATYS